MATHGYSNVDVNKRVRGVLTPFFAVTVITRLGFDTKFVGNFSYGAYFLFSLQSSVRLFPPCRFCIAAAIAVAVPVVVVINKHL